MTRFCVNLGFTERPLFAGFIWGLITGDMATVLSLAVFYELFWLDLFPAGTYIPPNPLFPMVCIFTLAGQMPTPNIAALFLPVILTLPLAFFGAYLEKRHRNWQVGGYNRLLRKVRTGTDVEAAATFSVGLSILQLFVLNFIVFFCITSVIYLAFETLTAWKGQPLVATNASWPLLWFFGAVGGVLSLRIRRSYLVFAIGSACVGALALFGVSM